MVADGRRREALVFATTQWRNHQDVRLSDAIMRLRHTLFVQKPGRPDWPPKVDDQFACNGIPEIPAEKLTPKALAAGILHHGGLILRGLVKEPEVSRLRNVIDVAMEETLETLDEKRPMGSSLAYSRCPDTQTDYVHYARGFTEGTRSAVLAGDSPLGFATLVDLYERTGVFRTIESYLGERPALSLAKTVLRRVPVTTGTDWHQDGAFLGAEIRVVNTWIALSECGIDAPGLDIVGRRIPRVLETGTEGAMFDWSVGPGTVEKHGFGKDIVTPVFKAGDAIMFDQLLLHRTGVRPGMTKDRYAIEAWMFAPSTFPTETFALVV
jgi:hypothetical protein